MLKSLQLEELAGRFPYLTAITKPQIDTLLSRGVLQMELFETAWARFTPTAFVIWFAAIHSARRNWKRNAKTIPMRHGPCTSAQRLLAQHPRPVSRRPAKSGSLRADAPDRYVGARGGKGRTVRVERDETVLAELARLDGCYVIKTDVADTNAPAELFTPAIKTWPRRTSVRT